MKAVFNFEKELAKLKKITNTLPPERKKVCEGIIADAAFLAEQLEILRKDITEHGWSEEYNHGGGQSGRKSRVEAETYIKLQKNYSVTINRLLEQLPKEVKNNDELMDWLND